MNNLKDIDPAKVDNTMSAISSVIKAIIAVAQCVDSLKNKPSKVELSDKPIV